MTIEERVAAMLDMPDSESGMPPIETDTEADKAVRDILRLGKEKARLLAIADEEIAELTMRRDAIAGEFDGKADWHKRRLESYFNTRERRATKTMESYRLLSGTLIRKQRQPELVRDEAAVLRWLMDRNLTEYAVADWRVKWDALKKRLAFSSTDAYVKDSGEKVDGIRVVPRPDEFIVKEG
jgi:phage host-nuclease inhibitor protein Gam